MPVQTPFSPSQSFTSFGNSCSSNHLSLPTMARRPIVGGNWKCNPESFSKLDDLIKIMKLEPKREVVVGGILEVLLGKGLEVPDGDGWRATHSWIKQNLQHSVPSSYLQFHQEWMRHQCLRCLCLPFAIARGVRGIKGQGYPSCGIFALECVSGSLRSNTTSCIWHHFIDICSGEHPRVRPELWLQRLWRFHRRNRRGAIEGAPVSTPIRFNQGAYWFSQHCLNES